MQGFYYFWVEFLTISDHINLAARIFAISIKKFIPIDQKKDKRGAKSSISGLFLKQLLNIPCHLQEYRQALEPD